MATKISTRPKSLPSLSSPLSLLWDSYRDAVHNNRLVLDILDETLSKLLFWIPHSDTAAETEASSVASNDESFGTTTSMDAAWREIGYGILSLHRLSMDLALKDTNQGESEHNTLRQNHYGMSIRTKNPPTMAATSARISLTVIHSLMPSLISLVVLRTKSQHRHNHNNTNSIAAAAAKARLVLEQAKFVLRMALLVNYWRQQTNTATDIDDYQSLMHSSPIDFGIIWI